MIEFKSLINELLEQRRKLLCLIEQKPVNDEQKEHIEKGKELLKEINKKLEAFNVNLPT